MTEEQPQATVTQADRDAVRAFHCTMLDRLMSDVKSQRPKLGDDEGDAGTLVQAFARHRLARDADVAALQERIADLESELEEALYQPWPKWAADMKKQIRDVSGYDGYDDATDGVNLPDELSELINELTEQANKNVAEARASRKLDELESSVEHYRNGLNEWIAKAQALATPHAAAQEREVVDRAAVIAIVKAEQRYEGSDFPVCSSIVRAVELLPALPAPLSQTPPGP